MARVSDISVLLFTGFNSRMCPSRETQKNSITPGHLGKQENMTFFFFIACLIVMVSSYVVSVIQDLFCKIAKQ